MDGWWADPAAMNHWKSNGPVQNTIEPIGSVIGSMAFNAQVQFDFQCFFSFFSVFHSPAPHFPLGCMSGATSLVARS